MAHLGTTLLLGVPVVSTVSTPTPRRHRPASNRSRSRARPHPGARGRSSPHSPPWHCLAGQPGFIDRSRRPSPTPPTSPTQSNMPTTNQLEVRWGHDGCTWALRSAYTGGTHVASVCRCAFCGDVSSGAGEPAHRLGHAHSCRSPFGEGWDHRRRSCRVHGHGVARWRICGPSMGGGCCACGRVPERQRATWRGVCGRAVAVGMFACPTLLRHAFLPHGPMDSPRAEDLCG